MKRLAVSSIVNFLALTSRCFIRLKSSPTTSNAWPGPSIMSMSLRRLAIGLCPIAARHEAVLQLAGLPVHVVADAEPVVREVLIGEGKQRLEIERVLLGGV